MQLANNDLIHHLLVLEEFIKLSYFFMCIPEFSARSDFDPGVLFTVVR